MYIMKIRVEITLVTHVLLSGVAAKSVGGLMEKRTASSEIPPKPLAMPGQRFFGLLMATSDCAP